MEQLRTIRGALQEIKQQDPATAVTDWLIRSAVKSGEIPSIKSGKTRQLIRMSDVYKYLEGGGNGKI